MICRRLLFYFFLLLFFLTNSDLLQAAPILLVADALLTLLTVQVATKNHQNQHQQSMLKHLCKAVVECFGGESAIACFLFSDGTSLQYRFPVLHAAGGNKMHNFHIISRMNIVTIIMT